MSIGSLPGKSNVFGKNSWIASCSSIVNGRTNGTNTTLDPARGNTTVNWQNLRKQVARRRIRKLSSSFALGTHEILLCANH